MRWLKTGLGLLVLVYVLILVVVWGAWLIDQGLFRVARMLSPDAVPRVPTIVVGLASLVVAGGLVALLVPRLWRARRRRLSTGIAVITAGLIVAVSASRFPFIAGTILSEEAVAATAAVARPACRGTAVPGAGSLLTGVATVNHVVVLDMDGNDHAWTGNSPATWRPSSIGDLEVLVCVDREETSVVAQVCHYTGGSDITRHTASRTVRIVEPATGKALATLTVSDAARACAQTERQDLTDLYGSVSWELVQTRVAGWLRDHDAATGSVGD